MRGKEKREERKENFEAIEFRDNFKERGSRRIVDGGCIKV